MIDYSAIVDYAKLFGSGVFGGTVAIALFATGRALAEPKASKLGQALIALLWAILGAIVLK